MHEILGLIFNLLIPIGLLLLGLQVIKSLVPGPYRFALRIGKSVARWAFLDQAKKRGHAFAALVHFPLVFALGLLIIGMLTATWQGILAGIVIAALAMLAKRGLAVLHRMRGRRRSLPRWR
jgi:hypothetical protein